MIHALVGSGLLLLLGLDVFTTAFQPGGRGAPINSRQNRTVWRLFRALGDRRHGAARDRFLAKAGPTLVLMTLFVWVCWLLAAFAIIYYPWVESFLVSPGSLRGRWSEAIYYSGYTAATLGFGDVVADSVPLRLLTVFEALAGFALLSISTTYLLAVYRELLTMRRTASMIAGYVSAVDVVPRLRTGAGMDGIARWADEVAGSLRQVLEAHFQYPILHYFRSETESRSLPVQLGRLLEIRRAMAEVQPAGTPQGAAHPSLLALIVALEEYLDEVHAHFVPGELEEHEDSPDRTERAHDALLEFMGYA